MKKGLLIAMLLSLPFSASAQNEVAMEEYLDGEIMHVLPNGELATLHYKNGMPLPESTMNRATSSPDGPGMSRSSTARS